MDTKRRGSESSVVPVKRSRHELVGIAGTREKAVLSAEVPRSSGLLAPIMLLEGHQGEVFAAKFHPEGRHIASAGFDRQIFIWNVYGECENVMVMKGHSGAITDLSFCDDGGALYSSSADRSAALWDVRTGTRLRRLRGHSAVLNCVAAGTGTGGTGALTGGDDGAKLWDARARRPAAELAGAPALCCALAGPGAGRGAGLAAAAGLDELVRVWDLRRAAQPLLLAGHADTVTGLAASADGARLLSSAADDTLREWDLRAWAAARAGPVRRGHRHGPERLLLRCAWGRGATAGLLAAGSADRRAVVWRGREAAPAWRLPGHRAPVTAVDLHPREPLLLSAGADKLLYLGELHLD